jgi:hypothetical protein
MTADGRAVTKPDGGKSFNLVVEGEEAPAPAPNLDVDLLVHGGLVHHELELLAPSRIPRLPDHLQGYTNICGLVAAGNLWFLEDGPQDYEIFL